MTIITLGQGNNTHVYQRSGPVNDSITDFGSTYFTTTLDSAQAASAGMSTASGSGTGVLNRAQTRFEIDFTMSGIDIDGAQTPGTSADNMTVAHIHAAPAGSNGGVVFGFRGPNNDTNGDLILDAPGGRIFSGWDAAEGNNTTLTAQLPNLLADGHYINIHTSGFGGGEIRGQILRADNGGDRIDVSAFNISNLATVQAILSDNGDGNAVLTSTFNGQQSILTLDGVSSASLTAADFIFGGGGSQTVIGTANADDLFGGDGADILEGRGGADRLDGGGGIDTLSYANSAAAVTVNLQNGAVSGGDAAGDTFTGIENLRGSAFADTLVGDANANTIWGGGGDDYLLDLGGGMDTLFGEGGNDRMQGSQGADSYDGGTGTDSVRYNNSDAAVTVSLLNNTASGGHATGDSFVSVEDLVGSTFGDTLIGNGAVNRLEGFAGDDLMRGGVGADVLVGGTGFDTADYSDSSAAVNVGLFRTGTGGTAQGDALSGIEAITGSALGDTLVGAGAFPVIRLDGGAGNDLLFDYGGKGILNGGAGNDTMIGRLGADDFDGGADIDVVRFADAVGAVTVDLTLGTGIGADAQGDTFVNVENLVGSIFFDTLIGDGGVNRLEGGAGRDRLTGKGGDDQLFGGADLDTFVFDTTDWGNDLIFDFDASRELIDVSAIGLTFDDFNVVDTAFGVRLDYVDSINGLQTIGLGGVAVADIDANDFVTM